MAGEAFNLDSPKQLQSILHDKLGLPVLRKDAGRTTVDRRTCAGGARAGLSAAARDHGLPQPDQAEVHVYRQAAAADQSAHRRIHTSYHQAVAATGRLSSADPNLQNIPMRTAEGRRIRQAFIAPDGRTLVAADYSQIELRIMAHLSADVGLQRAFSEGLDVHRATAAEVFGVPLDR